MDIPPYKLVKKQTEQLWASRKYDTMAHGYPYYKEIAAQFRNAAETSDLERIIQRLRQIELLPYSYPGMSTAIQHMWGYVKHHVTDKEKLQYKQLWSAFRADPDPPDLLLSSQALLQFLHHTANHYNVPYLQLSFQAGFSFLHVNL